VYTCSDKLQPYWRIGGAHVHGCMDGESLSFNEGMFQKRTFEIIQQSRWLAIQMDHLGMLSNLEICTNYILIFKLNVKPVFILRSA
jgi:hypothetical protein